ncbi:MULTISPECIES: putative quinol monooxygenase [Streptomyces]|uniref:Antibiotic biosynthesis monooxygenase n=1 Tax=Streptomyces qinglanensis TaxID=943816 RepID=A0A1E7K655_9ACTN|nr:MULTISPECIES: antibiotic biosynthesis monooxygenase family protein [Streptomyces]OEU99391.1 antibiotic biosynthesis monooxygenase [Streptomyces qinglanensis]OEV26101.1 antibiotic biosynthesis monooxygenase [Streptomyces nanshensis]OEV26104.1 antibiotic biosynthesis monooxygenase [Streptomyces nanshensis]
MSESSCVVVARYRTRPGREEEVLALLAELAAASRGEPGNLRYRVHQGIEDPRTVVLYEEYATEADFTAHCATAHFRDLVPGRIVPLLESRDVVRLTPVGEVAP